MDGYEQDGTVDQHIVSDALGEFALQGAFAWRGFQYVLVTTKGAATFRGGLGDISAQWTGQQLQAAATISFAGGAPGAATRLTELVDLTSRSLRSNLLTGLPTYVNA